MDKTYDLIIIGSGPAGLTASIYASRYKLDHLVFGSEDGGQMNEIYEIENWPGDLKISGQDLIARFKEHVQNYGVGIRREPVLSIEKAGSLFLLKTSRGEYRSRALVLAMGAEYRKMNIPGEKEYIGKGVSYCATCDAMFFREKIVAVVGGGNSAAVVAIELSDFAKKVYLINRGEKMDAEPALIEKINSDEKIEIIPGTGLVEIQGNEKVEKVVLDKAYGNENHLDVDGVFIEVGTEPGIMLARKLGVETDDQNYIKVDPGMSTNISGVFAAGDITTGSNKFRQVLTAAAEGSIAASGAYRMLKLK